MTEQEALARMIPPGQIRPGKMGCGGVIQILLTRACTKACWACTQGSNLSGKPTFMTLENFERAVLSLKGYFGLTALFGGQPTLHPQFPAICEILRKHVPLEKRGLWTNALNGHGAICRKTFLPKNCNLNVHLDQYDYDEFKRDWPESNPFGLTQDSRHSPPFVAMKDVIPDEAERWGLIAGCDINRDWSSILIEFRGQLRAFFCELAGAQANLHQDDPDYPDTGIPIGDDGEVSGEVKLDVAGKKWWEWSMFHFTEQVRKHCHECSVPLRAYGELAQEDDNVGVEQTSKIHFDRYQPKHKGRSVQLVETLEQLYYRGRKLEKTTDYMGNSKR